MDYQDYIHKFVQKVRRGPQNSPVFEANKHLMADPMLPQGSTWAGAGLLELGGFIWWTSDCNLALTDLSTGIKAVNFEASGTGFMVGAVESEVVGAFVVNPSTIGGSCHYSIAVGALEEGILSLMLYSTVGQLYGTFTGPCEGLAAGAMSGKGTLKTS